MNKSYEDLVVWQRAITLAKQVNAITRNYPKEEIYGLSSQTRRSAVSIASNIAEGCARHHNKEFLQFLGIASGSCAELHTQLLIATPDYIDEVTFSQLISELIEIRKMINGLKKSITL